jgi:hypothetical protein
MSDSDIRDWAQARGLKIGARGVIPAAVREAYNADAALGGADPEWSGAEDPPGPLALEAGSPLYFPEMPDVPADPPDMEEAAPEATPARGGSRAGRRLTLPGRRKSGTAAAKGKGRKPKRPRVPVDHIISDVWRFGAGLARPLPATSRLLSLQAPLAGMVLEEAVKNTVMDSVLQPFARTGKNAEIMWAMLGAPAITVMIQMRPGDLPFLLPVLRSSLMTMVRIMGPRIKEALQEETEFEKTYGETVDAMIVFLLQGVAVPDDKTEEQAEAETIRILHDEMSATGAA